MASLEAWEMCGRYETQDRIAAACTLEQETVQKMLLREGRHGAILRFPLLALYWQARVQMRMWQVQ